MATKTKPPGGAATEGTQNQAPVLAFGRLIRVALAPSAIADIVVGVAVGHGGAVPALVLPWLLIPASLGVYHGAMALNDWADRHEDAKVRPERPIPSGAIAAGLALFLGALMIAGGLLWAFAAGPRAGIWMAAVALCAVLYDVWGRGPIRGPLLLGLCRAGNLGAGLMSPWLIGATDTPNLPLLGIAGLYGLHVMFISRLGRLEDDEDPRPLAGRPSSALRGTAWTALLVPVAGLIVLRPWSADPAVARSMYGGLAISAGLGAWSASILLGRARAGLEEGWTRGSVGAATGLCLRRLPFYTASVACIALLLGPLGVGAVAVAILGARISAGLRTLFPLT